MFSRNAALAALSLSTLCAFSALAADKSDAALIESTRKAMLGEWKSAKGEVRTGANGQKSYLTRAFSVTPERNAATFVFFTDETFSTPNLTVRFSGPYTLLGASKAVKGALEANFPLSSLRLLPHTEGAVAWLNSAAPGTCGTQPWKVGVEQDVGATQGCSVLGINTANTVEHDIIKVKGAQLFFGARPADGGLLDSPAERPTALQVPVVRAR